MMEMKMKWERYWQRQHQQQRRVPAMEVVAQEELAQEATQDVGMGARMEATSHYVPTVERTGCTSLTTALRY